MKRIALLLAATVSTLLGAQSYAQAATYSVYDTYLTVFAQSATGSGASFVASSVPVYSGQAHPVCGNNLYIRFDDKELFSVALSATMNGKPVRLMYDDAAPYVTIGGHGGHWNCRIISMWVLP